MDVGHLNGQQSVSSLGLIQGLVFAFGSSIDLLADLLLALNSSIKN